MRIGVCVGAVLVAAARRGAAGERAIGLRGGRDRGRGRPHLVNGIRRFDLRRRERGSVRGRHPGRDVDRATIRRRARVLPARRDRGQLRPSDLPADTIIGTRPGGGLSRRSPSRPRLSVLPRADHTGPDHDDERARLRAPTGRRPYRAGVPRRRGLLARGARDRISAFRASSCRCRQGFFPRRIPPAPPNTRPARWPASRCAPA